MTAIAENSPPAKKDAGLPCPGQNSVLPPPFSSSVKRQGNPFFRLNSFFFLILAGLLFVGVYLWTQAAHTVFEVPQVGPIAKPAARENTMSPLVKKVEQLESSLRGIQLENQDLYCKLQLFLQLRQDIQMGYPFQQSLTKMKDMGLDIQGFKKMDSLPQTGVWSLKRLSKSAAHHLILEIEEESGLFERAQKWIKKLWRVEAHTPHKPNAHNIKPHVKKVQKWVNTGNLAEAISFIQRGSISNNPLAKTWLEQATQTLAAYQALEQIENTLFSLPQKTGVTR